MLSGNTWKHTDRHYNVEVEYYLLKSKKFKIDVT